jgi:hypothetical protein
MENPNYFIDPGADNEEPIKDIKQAHVREWHDDMEHLKDTCKTLTGVLEAIKAHSTDGRAVMAAADTLDTIGKRK